MKTNMGGTDKFIRFLLGVFGGLLVYYNILTEPTSYVVLVMVAILLLTAITGFCPLYGALGINSFRHGSQN